MKRPLACLLLGLCHAGTAAALGLGQLTVHSHLGQPLHASVALLDAPPDFTVGCVHLHGAHAGIVAPPPVDMRLEPAGNASRLHIRSRETINDPILQFTLVSDCQVRLQRDYTALLDPPSTVVPPAFAPAPLPDSATPLVRADAPSSPPEAAASSAATAKSRAPRKPVAAQARGADRPQLVLSGRHRSLPDAGGFALRLDTTLPDPNRVPEAPLTATELSDENTALARKLAHLETQLVELQRRNAELETQRAATSETVPAPRPESAPRWPLYLLLAALAAGVAGLALWLRRRARTASTASFDTPDLTPATVAPASSAEPEAPRAVAADKPPLRAVDVLPHSAQTEGTEIKEDILDQAEVFMAHGHGDLAVHLLQEHLREAPTESPVPWLLLLDLLHRAGDAAGYASASGECRRYFNINLAGHPISQDSPEPGPGIEAYPHVLEQLMHVWNTPDANAFFDDLIYDKRGGTRAGFEPGAYRDILMLRDIARQALPLAA